MSFKEEIKGIEDELGSTSKSSDFFRFPDGRTTVRVLAFHTKPDISYWFNGKFYPEFPDGIDNPEAVSRSVKFFSYLLVDGEIRLSSLPQSIFIKLKDLAESPSWEFDEFPMPYDIEVVYKPKESPAKKYSVNPLPHSDVEADVLENLEKEKPLDELAELIRGKRDKANDSTEEIEVDF